MSDLSEIKEKYDLATIISETTGQEVRYGHAIRCPFHADDTPSMMVYPDLHYHCFGCGAHGTVIDYLMFVWDCDIHGVRERCEDIAPKMPHYAPRITPEVKQPLDESMVKAYEDRFSSRELGVWRELGIPARVIYQFRIGFDGQRFSFPWYCRGSLNGIKLRRDDTINPRMEPKYKSVPGSHYAAPYNIDVLATEPYTVLIVEDEKSALAAAVSGIAAVAMPASQFKAEWAPWLSSTPELLIIADNDEPGLTSAAKVKKILPAATVLVPPAGKDLFDYWRVLLDQCGDQAIAIKAMKDWMGI